MTSYLMVLQKALSTVAQIEFLIKDLAEEQLDEVIAFDLDVGSTWECASWYIGVCVYNKWDDRAHDFCLFCGSPEERK